MRFSTSSAFGAFALWAASITSAAPSQETLVSRTASNSTCITPGAIPDINGTEIRNIGMVLFQAFDLIDVFGTLDPLQLMSLMYQQLNLHLIAKSLDPVQTRPISMNKFNSSFFPEFQPTNTFDDDLDLDVLIVPGGAGARSTSLEAELAYISKMFPKVKIFMTVCTGSGVAAQTGVLDGHLATTNKNAWATMTAKGPNVNWVTPARYVIDGKVWTSSGVTSALDMIFAFITTFWGSEPAERISHMMEHTILEASDDEFSSYYGLEPSKAQPCDTSA